MFKKLSLKRSKQGLSQCLFPSYDWSFYSGMFLIFQVAFKPFIDLIFCWNIFIHKSPKKSKVVRSRSYLSFLSKYLPTSSHKGRGFEHVQFKFVLMILKWPLNLVVPINQGHDVYMPVMSK